jgi:hypothetical protein
MNDSITLVKDRSITYLEYAVVFIIIFFAGSASVFARSFETWNNLLGLIIPVAAVAVLGLVKGVHFNHRYLMLMVGYMVYTVASTIKFGEIHPHFFGINVIKFTIAYVVMSSLRTRFFAIYEHILFVLAVIALILWTMHNAIPGTFVELLRNFEFSTQGAGRGSTDFNAIVYTVSNYDVVPDHVANFGGFQIYRNSGFAWEPGAFSAFINLAILFNIIRNNFRLKNNPRLWILTIALLTTFSTTGYSMFILMVFFYLYNQPFRKVAWVIPFAVVFTVLIFTLPFMADKISETTEYDTEELIYRSIKHDTQYAPQRFESLKIDFVDFMNHPVLGYGGQVEARWTHQIGAQIATISGIGKVLAQFGLVGLIFFLFSVWSSSKKLVTLYNLKGALFPVVLILMISISYTIFTILYACIWLFYLSSSYKTAVIKEYLNRHLLNSSNA